MAFEPAVIEQWIYETLTGDATLMGLLAHLLASCHRCSYTLYFGRSCTPACFLLLALGY